MNSKTLRIAVMGFGAIAEKHVEVFRDLGAVVCASCNRSETGRACAREKAGIPRTYANPLEMVECERPDGLLLTVSAVSMAESTRKLIPLGIPLLVEKPPALSLSETEELAHLAARYGTPVMVGLNRRFYSVYHKALEAMGGREAVTGVHVEWTEDPVRLREIGHPEDVIRSLNFANSLHGIDFLPFFGGSSIRGAAWGRDLGGESFRWQMAFDGQSEAGARLHCTSSWEVPGRWRLMVDAPGCRMVSAPLESASLLRRGKPPEEVAPSEEDCRFKPGFHGQARAFMDGIQNGATPPWPACTLAEATESMRIAEMLTSSCRGGARA